MTSSEIKENVTLDFYVSKKSFDYKNIRYKIILEFIEDSTLKLMIDLGSHQKVYEIFSPKLSVGHINYKTDQLHFVFGEDKLFHGKLIFIIDCGHKIPEFKIFTKNDASYKELIYFINHDTQNQINNYLENLPLQKVLISDNIYPFLTYIQE